MCVCVCVCVSVCVKERGTHIHIYIYTSTTPPLSPHPPCCACLAAHISSKQHVQSCSIAQTNLLLVITILVSADVFRVCGWQCVLFLMKVLHTGDVIAFYNSVFVPAVKTDLLRINQDRASLARPPVTESLLGASPARSYNR